MTVNQFIKFFSKIPKNRWCTDSFIEDNKCCAYGHLGCRTYNDMFKGKAGQLLKLFDRIDASVTEVNDTNYTQFKAKHPKTRILKALRAIKGAKK
jgi:hypothetical protein